MPVVLAPHLARPEGCAGLRIVLVNVPRVSRSRENVQDGFDLHLLQPSVQVWLVFPLGRRSDNACKYQYVYGKGRRDAVVSQEFYPS